ncbi:MAG: flagellar M-ring protein FliF [Roseburia sp.]|nr:flagellar M-ring protein FliF [Roseburia sp.]MCM1096965.1 flagellar M-ring protein FliF [Ruminococcus flavefaciens]
MADKLKEILSKIQEWWNKFTARQKTIIIAVAATVVFTFVIVIYAISRPHYTRLGVYSSTAESSKVVGILDDAGITHRESDDALTIDVVTDQLYQANLALGSAGIVTDRLSYSELMDIGMSTTSADRENQYRDYLERELELTLKAQGLVEDAHVILNVPPQNGTLAAQQEEPSAWITLTLGGNTLTSAQAAGLARCVSTSLGNATTANITIMDENSNLLFAGGEEYSAAGVANSLLELKNQAEAMTANQLKKVLYGTKQYSLIEVTSHLDLDFAEYQRVTKEYYTTDGADQGYYGHRDEFESSSTNEGGGIPGTDSNDGENLNTYVYPDYGDSESSQTETSTDYLLNERSESTVSPAGGIKYESSSLAISMIKYREYHEESVQAQGLLAGTSWEEFKEAHREDIKLEVDEEYYQMAAMATGISADQISILAYETPLFYDKEGFQISGTDILSIVMIILILGLLAFVLIRSMVSRKEKQEEEELSVESMLQSTPENMLEDIDVETKSETRKMIEKFVDDNPEAAANLLRNWLTDEWE